MQRDKALQRFTDAALAAYQEHALSSESRTSLNRIAAALEAPGPQHARPGNRLPVCSHLDTALTVNTDKDSLQTLIESFRAIEPSLEWQRRASFNETASSNFSDGHANAMILGPAGPENRNDIWLGVSLLAPAVRYTDHAHAPEETYLVLSEGRNSAWSHVILPISLRY